MKAAILFSAALVLAWAQGTQGDRVTVPFSDPSRPGTVKASVINSSLIVNGYDGKDVAVEARTRPSSSSRPERADGLRRLDVGGSGLRVEESDNTITVGVGLRSHPDLLIQAPFSTSVKLSTVNGSIEVNRLTGDLEISTTNGAVTASHISGSAVFHSLNGKILAAVEKISADKPMSFSSLNGDIDVTFPADVKARVKLKTHNGEVYSDFDVHLESTAQTVVENKQSTRGRYRVRSESSTYGNINGGGAEIQFTTFNGTIYIRKAK